ncbi:hypothetical protein [Nocardiopsis sp. Huas11]|uniref:hypothetical protein n=1 Tax=Nocardiopsis sp. Huas11 TaxID=2183912 RepID=UPI000EB5BEB6|nr:hypothetical protein [Nocardiopsis sp. Huas11]
MSPPPPASPPHPTPPAPDGEIRPRRLWYWVGGLVFATFLTAGVLILVFGTSPERPDPSSGFQVEMDSTETVTFEVGEGESGSWALYGSSQASSLDCDHLSPFGVPLPPRTDRYSYESDNGEWHYLATLDTGDPGTHSITCSAGVNTRYAVGDIDVVTTADSRLGLGVVSGILLPMAGAFVSLLIVVVTLVMRVTRTSELRRRRARQWPPHPGAPGAYPCPGGHPASAPGAYPHQQPAEAPGPPPGGSPQG